MTATCGPSLPEAEVDAFILLHKLEVHKKRRARILKMSPEAWETYKLSVVVSVSCKGMDLRTAFDAYALFRQAHFPLDLSTNANTSSSSRSKAPSLAPLQPGAVAVGACRPSLSLYTTLLSLVAGLGDQGSSSGPVRAGEPPSDVGRPRDGLLRDT